MPRERRRRRRRGSSDGGGSNIFEKAAGGYLGLAGNLFGDVKDAVVGLPMGTVKLVTDPVESVEAIGKATWHTWSPLFAGDFAKFGKQLYDHPLAPILDVASVLTLGAGSAARGASALSKAGVGGARVEKVAAIRGVKTPRKIADPTGKRHDLEWHPSPRAGRYALQQLRQGIEQHMPDWYVKPMQRLKYEKTWTKDMGGRVVAKSLVLSQILEAGKRLSDESVAPFERMKLLTGNHLGLIHHGIEVDLAEAVRLGADAKKGHYIYARDLKYANGDFAPRILKLQKQEVRWAARAEKTGSTQAAERAASYRARRLELEESASRRAYEDAGVSHEEFLKAAHALDRTATTRKVELAAKTNEGKVVIVPRHDAYNLGLEMESASKFARYAYHKPTQLWKMAMIGLTPRSITNNAVGNWTLYALREGPSMESAQALHDAIRWQYGAKRANEIFDESFVRRDVISREFGDVVGNVFSAEIQAELSGAGRIARRAGQGFYPIVHMLADKPVRVASLYRFFREQPEVKAALRDGVDLNTAITRALREKPYLRGAAVDHVNKTAGDYVGLMKTEKIIRSVVPFYLWYRHIARTTGNMVLDTPARAAVMQRLSALGIEETQELLGEIPEFLNGAIPLSALGLGKGDGDRADIMLTGSLNPFASISELASLVEAFTVGTGTKGNSAAAIGLNPLLTGTIEAMTGRSLLSGAERKGFGGIITSVLKATGEGLPQVRLGEALLSPDTSTTAKGNDLLYARDDRGPITSLFGVPLRNMSKETAERRAGLESDETETTGRRKRRERRVR